MAGRRDHHQLITMNVDHGKALVIYGNGYHAEVHHVVVDRSQDLGPLQPRDLHAHIGI